VRTQLPRAALALVPGLPGQDLPASAPATCPGTQQLPLTARIVPKVRVTRRGPRGLGATQDTVATSGRELQVHLSPRRGDSPGAPRSSPGAVRAEARGTAAQRLAGLPSPPPHLADDARDVLLVLRSEVRGDLYQHGWLALAGQHIPCSQHLGGTGQRVVGEHLCPTLGGMWAVAAGRQARLSLHSTASGMGTLRHTGPQQLPTPWGGWVGGGHNVPLHEQSGGQRLTTRTLSAGVPCPGEPHVSS